MNSLYKMFSSGPIYMSPPNKFLSFSKTFKFFLITDGPMYSLTWFYNIQVWFRACSAHNLFFKFYLASVLCAWLTRSSFSKCFLAFRMLIRVASEAASKTQKQCYSICSNEIHKWKIICSSPFHGTNRTHIGLALCDFLSIWHFQFVLHIIIIVYSTIKLADLTHSIESLK